MKSDTGGRVHGAAYMGGLLGRLGFREQAVGGVLRFERGGGRSKLSCLCGA